jgi:nucleoside-diphosphate-sugar epimerase
MTCLVTGGAGFIGSHLADRLVAEGHRVIIVDNLSFNTTENICHHFENSLVSFVERDICENLDDIFSAEKIDVVFHLASVHSVPYSIEHPRETHHSNVNGTVNVFHAAREHGVSRVVFSSSAAVYGNVDAVPIHEDTRGSALSPYALHKSIGEHYASLFGLLYGTDIVCLRYFNVFGPRQNPNSQYAGVIPKWMKIIFQDEQPLINGDGLQTRDYVHVSDVVDAVLRAASHDKPLHGMIINIGGGKGYSVNDLFSLFKDITGLQIEARYGQSVIEARHSVADITRARELFDWQPRVSLPDGLQETYAYLRDRLKVSV